MLRSLLILYFSLIPGLLLFGQVQQLQLKLIDKQTHQPITDAHVFIANTTIGSISDPDGTTTIRIQKGITEDLIISHLNYETQLIEHQHYSNFTNIPTLFLTSNGNDLSQITITADRGRGWKKNYNRFKESFLGKGKEAKKCKILNPEVLRFNETQDGTFITTALDMIHIQNDFLGYNLDFLLTNLTITQNGSISYLGRAKFTERNTKDPAKTEKNRLHAYEDSPRHFFQSLINNRLDKDKYDVSQVSYINGEFQLNGDFHRDSTLTTDSLTGNYKLAYSEFLEITNLRKKSVNELTLGSIGGLESQRFSNSRGGGTNRIKYAVSFLYKLTPEILLDQYGHVLNHKQVQEYGHWANQRIATTLPWDYGIKYSSPEGVVTTGQVPTDDIDAKLLLFQSLIYSDLDDQKAGLNYINNNWDREFIAPLLEILRLSTDPTLTADVKRILQTHEGSDNIPNFYGGLRWLWQSDPVYSNYYADLKGDLYKHIDPKFETYFKSRQSTSSIRIDEILWGGVGQDGIPPLRYPELISADDASYLDKEDIIFGMVINGIAKAYPKRILAWHEFVVDTFGDQDIAGVYCTLCGTVIAYDMSHNGVRHDLGTSGFLYRSNKLMYDRATQSLWSTVEGTPVMGPLTGQDIYLNTYPVITTTWGDWKKSHPESKVLSLETGHNRNYSEGAAYRSYFSNDELMFPVPRLDDRLRNKDEVLIVRSEGYQSDPIALSISYLKKKRIHTDQINGKPIIIITESTGAARVYDSSGYQFQSYKKGVLIDSSNSVWVVSEEYLESTDGTKLERLPAHNIFWFAWYNLYPGTRLVK